jgi:glycosidase
VTLSAGSTHREETAKVDRAIDWVDSSIWWHVYPLGFTGAEHQALPPELPPVHRLNQLENWLDYLVDLGCNGLALGPVFSSESHGYDTVDHFRIDSRLGDEDDLVQLIGKASARGVRVLLDGVFNHVGRSFPAFADVTANGAASPYVSWFRPDTDGHYSTFEGHHRLVELNHDTPEVADYVTDVMTHWLERGIAGWRLDAAYAVPLPFWRSVTDRVHARFPDAWVVGEVIRGEFGEYVQQGGLDSVTQYELWKGVWSSLNDGNFFELAWALKRHDTLLETFIPHTFLGNHDVTRLASRLEDERMLPHALVILMTVAGIPSVYAGDEQAFRGVKEEREGGDDAIRPAFPAQPEELAAVGQPYYRLHQLLIGLRRRHPWLVRARTTVAELTNTTLSYTATDGTQSVAVALNIADQPADVSLPSARWEHAAGPGEVVHNRARLPAWGWLIGTKTEV